MLWRLVLMRRMDAARCVPQYWSKFEREAVHIVGLVSSGRQLQQNKHMFILLSSACVRCFGRGARERARARA